MGHSVALAFLLALVTMPGSAGSNPLRNDGFEEPAGTIPAMWFPYGPGRVATDTEGAHGGRRCIRLEGGPWIELVYQWIDGAVPGSRYTATVWAKSASGPADGAVKIEFMDHLGNKREFPFSLKADETWRQFTFTQTATPDAMRAALTLCAGAGATILFDDAALAGEEAKTPAKETVFDLKRLGTTIAGFGVHHWASERLAREEFGNLHISHIRITRDSDSYDDMRELKRVTDARGIKWLYVIWVPDGKYLGLDGQLADVPGYARFWIETVRELDREGCRPHFIDLVNEPDYFGIPPAPYNELVKLVRKELDKAGFADVRIAGPGLTHIGAENMDRYMKALDANAVKAIDVWATHAWEDAWDDSGGSVSITENRAAQFVGMCRERDATKPVWYTEYATRQIRFHGIRYPHPDNESDNYCASFTMPYAARVYENTLAILNGGANIPFYWCSQDWWGSRKQWGYIGPQGEKKPVYHALRALYGNIKPGSRTAVPPDDMWRAPVYSGVYINEADRTIVVGMANTADSPRKAVIRLKNAPGRMKIVRAEAVEIDKSGDAARKIADVARTVEKPVKLGRKGGDNMLETEIPSDGMLTVILSYK